jgi:hypothetical protein
MVTTIVLLLCFSLAFVAGGFIAFKGVQLGLLWQIQTTQHKPPELTLPNPIQPLVDAKKEKDVAQQVKEAQSLLDEWVNGPVEESR